jgi:pilus assembly protein Flp/PilA
MTESILPTSGQGLVEYAMIIMLVGIIVIIVLALLGPAVGNMFSNVVSQIWTLWHHYTKIPLLHSSKRDFWFADRPMAF